jgi:hypothetical protein
MKMTFEVMLVSFDTIANIFGIILGCEKND